MVTKVGTSGQEGAICIVWYSADKCCGLYESNNGEVDEDNGELDKLPNRS